MTQKERIKNLEERLELAKKNHYLHHSNNVWVGDFKDLPFIISQVVKENQKMQDYYLGNILDELKELKKYKR